MGIKTVDPVAYDNCKKCEEYLGGLAAMQGVLKTHGTKDNRITLNVGLDETASVSASRLWQYVLEREEEERRKNSCKENAWRVAQMFVAVIAAVFAAVIAVLWQR